VISRLINRIAVPLRRRKVAGLIALYKDLQARVILATDELSVKSRQEFVVFTLRQSQPHFAALLETVGRHSLAVKIGVTSPNRRKLFLRALEAAEEDVAREKMETQLKADVTARWAGINETARAAVASELGVAERDLPGLDATTLRLRAVHLGMQQEMLASIDTMLYEAIEIARSLGGYGDTTITHEVIADSASANASNTAKLAVSLATAIRRAREIADYDPSIIAGMQVGVGVMVDQWRWLCDQKRAEVS